MRANPATAPTGAACPYFNSRPRMRANLRHHTVVRVEQFQLPPTHEGERISVGGINKEMAFQLPPSHEGERKEVQNETLRFWISTPALA